MHIIKPDIENQWIREFKRDLKVKDRSPLTIKCYSNDIELFFEWHKATKGLPINLQKIIGFDLMLYRKHLLNDKKYKGSTINRKIEALRQFFRWAYHSELIQTEISQEVRFVKAAKRYRPVHLDPREINALLRTTRTARSFLAKRNLAIVQLFLHTGIRVAEMANITFSDITISDRRGSLRIREGKGRREREIPLNKTARNAASAYFKTLKEATTPDSSLFRSERETPLSCRAIQGIISQTAKRAEINRIRVSAHTLRHTFAMNYMSANSGKLVELANLLGHESLDTTSIYLQPSNEDLAEALERMTLDGDT